MTRLPVAVATLVVLFTLVTFAVAPGFSTTSPSQARPANKSHPFIGGTAGTQRVLQASTGSWKGRSVSYSFQWKRCNSRGGKCGAVSGATGSSYLTGTEDIGHTLRVAVTARNGHGSTTATSTPKRVGPPSSANGSVAFDGSAAKMRKLYSVGADNQGQSPSLWTCLCFENNDISLQPDARYGQTYEATVASGDANPWNTGHASTSGAGQMSVRRSNDLGKWDWYAIAVKLPSTWQRPPWTSLVSLGYETLASDQLALGVATNSSGTYFTIHQNSGLVSKTSTGFHAGAVSYVAPVVPVTYDAWQEFVIGVKWATDRTGAVEVYTRTPGSKWRHAFEKTHEPTYAYGTTQYGTIDAKLSQKQTVIDKIGLYFGGYSTTSFPTETVYESGLTRSSNLATAQSTLP